MSFKYHVTYTHICILYIIHTFILHAGQIYENKKAGLKVIVYTVMAKISAPLENMIGMHRSENVG